MKNDITISLYSNSPNTRGVERIDYGSVTIYKTSVGPMDNNVYLLVDSREPDNSLLIDAATDAEHLICLVEHVSVQACTVVTTRSRGDHVQTLDESLQAPPAHHITSGLDAADIPRPANQQFGDGETIMFGQGATLSMFILRGHTKGGFCPDLPAKVAGTLSNDTPSYYLSVGDSIFPGGTGKVYSPEDFSQLIDSVENRVFHVYPTDSIIRPGHDKDITVGVESPEVGGWHQHGW